MMETRNRKFSLNEESRLLLYTMLIPFTLLITIFSIFELNRLLTAINGYQWLCLDFLKTMKGAKNNERLHPNQYPIVLLCIKFSRFTIALISVTFTFTILIPKMTIYIE